MLLRYWSTALLFVLAGCGTSPLVVPHVMHPAGVAPSDTSIFVAADQRTNEAVMTTLQAMDGVKVNCDWNAGCPVWIRVSPQSHEFTIAYSANHYGLPGVTNFRSQGGDAQSRYPKHGTPPYLRRQVHPGLHLQHNLSSRPGPWRKAYLFIALAAVRHAQSEVLRGRVLGTCGRAIPEP